MAVRLREYVYSGRGHERQETAFRDKGALLRRLRELMGGEPVFVDLVHEDEDTLTIGVGGPQACVMYVRGGGDPPYLWASRAAGDDEPDMEFDACGTATPVPASRLIPPDRAIDIAAFFFDTGFIPEPDEWEAD